MTQASARLLAATFRASSIQAQILPPSDAMTLELGAMYTAGDECYPQKITLGDYLKVTRQEGFDPAKTAFLMPTAQGPCRFGQYWPLLEGALDTLGLSEVLIINPTSGKGYENIGGNTFFRTAWAGMVAADILRKILLRTRPYEINKGSTDDVYETSLQRLERVIEKPDMKFKERFEAIREGLRESRDEFRRIDAAYVKGKPLITVVGEIFCRHNRFANDDMLHKLEEHGAETWISDVAEWVLYTDWSRMDNERRRKGRFSSDIAVTKIKNMVMKRDEHKLLELFHDDFLGYEEPKDTDELVTFAEPYLPARGALGEMSLSLGKAAYCYHKGIDGVVDISPFSCMNGIVSEAVYPSFSRDHNDIPSHVFYFDGVNSDIDRDLGIFMELVRGYMSRKNVRRVYPKVFTE